MKILIDMNLSPAWVEALRRHGYEAAHWSTVGDPKAADATVMEWARDRAHVVFTHDLDFGAALAVTQDRGPSVLQFRTQDVSPESLVDRVVEMLGRFRNAIEDGALIVVDETKSRVRILPLKRQPQ